MHLQAQPPAGMRQTVGQGLLGMGGPVRPIQGLQEEVAKVEPGEAFRGRLRLRIDQLQFVAGPQDQLGIGLGADADPVQPRWRRTGAVGLDGDFEAAGLEGGDQGGVQLQQGLPAGADDIGPDAGARVAAPGGLDPLRQCLSAGKPAAPDPVGTPKLGVAEGADGLGPVLLAPGPEIAAGEAAEDRRPAGLGAFPCRL
jgi:hypothetical protein